MRLGSSAHDRKPSSLGLPRGPYLTTAWGRAGLVRGDRHDDLRLAASLERASGDAREQPGLRDVLRNDDLAANNVWIVRSDASGPVTWATAVVGDRKNEWPFRLDRIDE